MCVFFAFCRSFCTKRRPLPGGVGRAGSGNEAQQNALMWYKLAYRPVFGAQSPIRSLQKPRKKKKGKKTAKKIINAIKI